MFGGIDVALDGDFSRLGTIQTVTVAGVRALDVRASGGTITVRVQGAPDGGAASISIVGTQGTATNDGAFTYDPPSGGAPPKWAAFGASLTQGVQSAGLDAHGQTMGYAAQVALAAGVFLAPPLVVDTLAPPLQPSAFIGNCSMTPNDGALLNDLLTTVTDPATHGIDFRRARQDPTLATRNFAVGGATVADVIAPASGPVRVLERITEQPDGDPSLLAAPSTKSQLERLAELDPDVAFCADLLANDGDGSVTQPDDLHPELFTEVTTIASELGVLTSRLGALHGDYFIANLMDMTALPHVADLRAQRLAAGLDTAASFDAKAAQIRSLVDAYNAALESAVQPYENLHVVDLRTATSAIISAGVVVDGVMLTGGKFGGLLSLDHLHFTDTAYALTANMFIDAINQSKSWHIPEIDEIRVFQQDALTPPALHAAGVFCDSP